jgi:uncharacterized membrane protein
METKSESILLAHGLMQDPGAIPLVIAVVGHRDPRPEYLPQLTQNLKLQFNQLINELPNTPLLMLNGLAEGIDTLAAEVFLDTIEEDRLNRGEAAPHHQLVGALPKTPDEYRQDDFINPTALHKLDQLIIKCDGLLHPGNCSELALGTDEDGRQMSRDASSCYGKQGMFLVRHCFMLFAFFDGVHTLLVGGTSQTVSMQKGEVHPLFISVDEVLANKEPGTLVIHNTPRLKTGSPQDKACEVSFWPSSNADGIKLPERHLTIPRKLDHINKQLAKDGLSKVSTRPSKNNTSLWHYANTRAIKFKQNYLKWCRALVLTGLALVLITQLSLNTIVQAICWAFFLLAYITFPLIQRGPKHEFMANRCLTECLTVQHLWDTINIQVDTADLFHAKTNNELAWIRTILRAVRLQVLSFHSKVERSEKQALTKASEWITGQVSWLEDNSTKSTNIAKTYQLIATILGALAVIIAFLGNINGISKFLGAWVIIIIAIFASIMAYSNLMGYQETADRYARSLSKFKRAKQALDILESDIYHQGNLKEERQKIVIKAIGREKLDELNDWVANQLQRVYAPGS